MIEYSERYDALEDDVRETSSPFFPSVRDGLPPIMKRYLLSWNVSGMLLGGLIVFSPMIDGGTTHVPVMIIRLALLGAVVAWMISQMKKSSIALARNYLAPLLVLFLVWAGLSVCGAPYKNASLQWFISLVFYVVLFGLVCQGMNKAQIAWQVLILVIAVGMFEAVLGIIQYIWFDEPRAKGTFFNPNFFATYEVVALSLVFALLFFTRGNEKNEWQKWVLWTIVAVTFVAFMLAQSRGGSLALVVVAAFIGWSRFGRVAMLILALCLVVGMMIPNPLMQRMSLVSKQDPYAFSRVQIWQNSIQRIIDRPLGFGLGMYKYTSFRYRFPVESNIVRYGKRAESAHNEYLQFAVELGVVGIGMFLIGIAMWITEVRSILRGTITPRERALVVGAAGGVLAILSHGLVDSVFHEPALVILLIVFGGLVFALQSARRSDMTEWRVPFSYHPVRLALVLLFGGLISALILQPAAGWYAYQRGEVEAHAGKPELALQWFEAASLIDPATPGSHDAIARISIQLFHQSGNPQLLLSAVAEEKLAAELNPLDGRFPYRLGTIYGLLAMQNVPGQHRLHLLSQAAQAYELAIQADPYSPLNYMELANIRLLQGRGEEAKSWLRQAVAYEPDFLPARMRLAELSLGDGNIEEAKSEFDAIVAAQNRHGGRILNDLERRFLDVDPSPLRTALARWAER